MFRLPKFSYTFVAMLALIVLALVAGTLVGKSASATSSQLRDEKPFARAISSALASPARITFTASTFTYASL